MWLMGIALGLFFFVLACALFVIIAAFVGPNSENAWEYENADFALFGYLWSMGFAILGLMFLATGLGAEGLP